MTGGAGRALVVAGGAAPGAGLLAGAGPWDLVVVADSGLDHALALGLDVDLVVGQVGEAQRAGRHGYARPLESGPSRCPEDLELGPGERAQSSRRISLLAGGHWPARRDETWSSAVQSNRWANTPGFGGLRTRS